MKLYVYIVSDAVLRLELTTPAHAKGAAVS